MKKIDVSVVMPCLNEERSIGICVDKAIKALRANGYKGEVVVSDNGSTDNSVRIAKSKGARVVHQEKKGYGNAYQKAFAEAKGKYIVMGDSDDTYDFSQLKDFVEPLKQGNDMVMGTRLKGKIMPGAMPKLHQYLGNPALSAMLNYLFQTRISDSHCGMRGITKKAYEKLNLKTSGMEYASEMVIKAGENKLKIKEEPITYYPREGTRSKLSSFKDGWRHVRFMLLYTPINLFLIPGFVIAYFGAVLMAFLMLGPARFFGVTLYTHPILFGSMLVILGIQIALFGIFTRVYRTAHGLGGQDDAAEVIMKKFTLEKGLVAGFGMTLLGVAIAGIILYNWVASGFGTIAHIQYAIAAFTLVMVGMQIIFSSFFISIIAIRHN